MAEDNKLKNGRLAKLYGWLRGKISSGCLGEWREHLPATSYFVLLLVSALYFRNLCTLLILGLCVHAARKTVQVSPSRLHLLLAQSYALIPSFSMLYLLNLKSRDLIVWLSLLVLTIRVSTHVFEGIFEGKVLAPGLHPSRTTMGFCGSLLVSVPVGLVSSLFLRQRLIRFSLLNVFLALLLHLQDVLDYRLGKHLNPTGKDYLIRNYNGLLLVTSFLTFLIMFGFVRA